MASFRHNWLSLVPTCTDGSYKAQLQEAQQRIAQLDIISFFCCPHVQIGSYKSQLEEAQQRIAQLDSTLSEEVAEKQRIQANLSTLVGAGICEVWIDLCSTL